MSLAKTIKRVLILKELIEKEETGSVKSLSEKLDINKRHVFNYISAFKKAGYPIVFDKQLNSYVFTSDEKKPRNGNT